MNFGERMRDRRKELNLSRAELAQALGVSASAIGNYETGISFPKEEVMLQLFDCLQIDPNYLYRDSFRAKNSTLTHNEREMMDKFRQLSQPNREAVRGMIDALWTTQQEVAPTQAIIREIPLYRNPAAAGYAAPTFGTDFELIPVQGDVPPGAEFAVRIQEDSMEPEIADGSVVYVNRDPLREGDVGIFCVDGSIFCKQYYRDDVGTVYLFSCNRQRSDADVVLANGSERMFACFGRVMMKGPALPG